ncbi:MAG: SRPBCC domain-containing protein, partial [Thermoplasmata archaeon]
ATLAPRRGGTYQFTWEGGPTHTGKVVEYVRGKRIALAWQWPGHESLRPTTLRFDVQGRHGGTQLVLTHSGFLRGGPWGDLYEGAIRGWTYFTMNLKAVLETGRDLRSPCDW